MSPAQLSVSVVGTPAACRNDLPSFEKCVGNGDSLIEQSAWVVAQIENNAAQFVAGLLLDALHRIIEPDIGLLVERGDSDVTDVVADKVFRWVGFLVYITPTSISSIRPPSFAQKQGANEIPGAAPYNPMFRIGRYSGGPG